MCFWVPSKIVAFLELPVDYEPCNPGLLFELLLRLLQNSLTSILVEVCVDLNKYKYNVDSDTDFYKLKYQF